MPRIEREQENTHEIINWFSSVLGNPTDMHLVEFQILNIESGLPGTQVFPATGWEDVTSGGGHYATGHYFAYDNANSRGWTPEAGASLGTHRINWRWKQFAASSYQQRAEDFELVAQAAGAPFVLYNTVSDVRALGIPDPPTDDQVEDALITWQMALERACRQWFYSRELTILADGNDSDTLHFGVPVIEVEHVKINRSGDALGADRYKVYNGRTYPDDRRNPKLRLIHSTQLSDIYVAPWSRGQLRFHKGYQNQEIKGTFGYLEPDGTTPRLIKRAHLKLVAEKLTRPIYTPAGEAEPEPSSTTYAGVVIEEKTDGHSIKYGSSSFKDRRVGLSGLTQDTEILDIIKLYRAPLGIASPSHWSYY